MNLPNITFIKGQGGLGRPLPGQDYVSGLLFYTGTLPSGFTSGTRVKALYSVADAEALGILDTYADATAATATYEITTLGATGDIFKLTVADINEENGAAQTQTLVQYTKVAGDTTIAILGASITAAINALTVSTGYSASFATATITITAPKKLGIYLNTGTPYAVAITGTIAGTLVQNVVAGAASLLAIYHYHVSEFFRIMPKGVLYIGFYAVPSPYTFDEITLMQQYADGAIRQIGIYKNGAAYATADLTAINTVCVTNDGNKKPLSALYAADLMGTSDISTLADLSTFSNNKVSALIAQDGGGYGYFLSLTYAKSITALGAALATVALSKVSESIAWVGQFNVSNGTELEVLAFSNGKLFSDTSVTDSLLEALNLKRFIFLRKFVGRSGSYWNDSHTAIVQTSDYAYIENNRTIDKATRLLYTAYLPSLNGPIQLNADGTISDNTVTALENIGDVALDQMLRDAEISAKSVTIDPMQDVLATSTLVVAVTLVINGVARQINIPIGFKPSIS
jgi:hypothetical protein